MRAHGIFRRHFARTKAAVQLDEAVRFRSRRILFQRLPNDFIAGEQILYRSVGAEAQRAQKNRDTELLLSVHADIQGVRRVLFEFQPCAAVGHHRRREHLLARLILRRRIIHARRTDQLGDDDALRTVDDERAVLRHERKIAHEYFLVENFVLHLVHEADFHPQRKRVRRVAVAAFLLVVFRLVAETMVEKVKLKVVGVVGNRGKILEYLADTFLNERIVAVLLNLYEVGNVNDFVDRAEFSSLILAILVNR